MFLAGGRVLVWIFSLLCFFLFAGMVLAADGASSAPAAPPKARVEVVEDTFNGHKIADPYRWLEDSDSAETQEFVRAELAYTRGVLDPLPGRNQINQELTELLSIGNIGTPQVGGKYYFYVRRDGKQNQAVLLVREGVHGKDRTLVDPNLMSTDGTVALDWWAPTDDGKYVAYGTSSGGSEESTLRIVETSSGKLLPDTIDRARHANVAWKKDDSGFLLWTDSEKRRRAGGGRGLSRQDFLSCAGQRSGKRSFDLWRPAQSAGCAGGAARRR